MVFSDTAIANTKTFLETKEKNNQTIMEQVVSKILNSTKKISFIFVSLYYSFVKKIMLGIYICNFSDFCEHLWLTKKVKGKFFNNLVNLWKFSFNIEKEYCEF